MAVESHHLLFQCWAFLKTRPSHPYHRHTLPYSAWQGIRLCPGGHSAIRAKLSPRCQQCAGWPRPCPSSWLSRYVLTGKLHTCPTAHIHVLITATVDIYNFNRSYNLPNIAFSTSVLFSKCLKSELETNLEGHQTNPHFKKIPFSHWVHENPGILNIMNVFPRQLN